MSPLLPGGPGLPFAVPRPFLGLDTGPGSLILPWDGGVGRQDTASYRYTPFPPDTTPTDLPFRPVGGGV